MIARSRLTQTLNGLQTLSATVFVHHSGVTLNGCASMELVCMATLRKLLGVSSMTTVETTVARTVGMVRYYRAGHFAPKTTCS